jgi:hypothetical protein
VQRLSLRLGLDHADGLTIGVEQIVGVLAAEKQMAII